MYFITVWERNKIKSVRTFILLPTIQLHLEQKKTDEKFRNPWGNKRKSSTHLPPSFPWLTPETLDSPSIFILFSNTRKKQKNSSTKSCNHKQNINRIYIENLHNNCLQQLPTLRLKTLSLRKLGNLNEKKMKAQTTA